MYKENENQTLVYEHTNQKCHIDCICTNIQTNKSVHLQIWRQTLVYRQTQILTWICKHTHINVKPNHSLYSYICQSNGQPNWFINIPTQGLTLVYSHITSPKTKWDLNSWPPSVFFFCKIQPESQNLLQEMLVVVLQIVTV